MAWCERCEAAWDDGADSGQSPCPRCGTVTTAAADEVEAAPEDSRVPWHLKLLLVALVAYLGWRAVQGVLLLLGTIG